MELVFVGDPKHYDEVRARAYVYKCDGEYQSHPMFIQELTFSNQFNIYEIISKLAVRVGLNFDYDAIGFEPDIRKIEIAYI